MRKTILSAALMILFSMTMLVGTTYAWWSEEIVVTGNKLETGNLDIIAEIFDPTIGEYGDFVDLEELSINAIFYNDNVQPGTREMKIVRITNNGSIPVFYRISTVVDESNTLRNHIKFSINDQSSFNDDLYDKEPIENITGGFSYYPLMPGRDSTIEFSYEVDKTLGDDDGDYGEGLTLPFIIKFEAIQLAQKKFLEEQD
jgi:hypothetical protein